MNKLFSRIALLLTLLSVLLTLAACGGSSNGYTFTVSGTKIAVGAPSEAIISTLGTPVSTNVSPSCGGIPGNDCIYTYKGFRVKTTPSEDGDIICLIELTDDTLKTPEGLYIGMSAEDAKAAMSGKGTAETVGENLIYVSGDMKLQVLCRNGSVTGILYVPA